MSVQSYTIFFRERTIYKSFLRVWFSGRIPPCQGEDAGSIPATRHYINRQKNYSVAYIFLDNVVFNF